MKQKILYILFLITSLSWSLGVGAQTVDTYYVCDDANERSWSTIGNSGSYELKGPAKILTFQAKRTNILGFGNDTEFYAEYSTDDGGKTWEKALKLSLDKASQWYDFSCEVPINAKYVRFETMTLATGNKQIRNVKVTRATTLETTSSSLEFGEVKCGESSASEKTINVKYNNTYRGAVLTGTCDNSAFTVTKTDMGETGSENITIAYTPTALGEQTGTITLKMGTPGKENYVTATFTVSGTGTTDYFFSASTGVNRETYGTASVAFEEDGVETSVLNTTASSVEKTVSFSATANDGYEFVGWGTTMDATSYESTDNPYEPTLLNETMGSTKNKTLYAIFKPVFNFSTTATSSNAELGTATATVANVKILGDVDATQAETTATFTATPADGCIFKGWYETEECTGDPISTNQEYGMTLSNNEVGTTTSKALYALFKKKQNLQWKDAELDLNLVKGQYCSSVATVTSDKIIKYTSSNTSAVTIDADGTIHAVGLGDSKVTASVEGDDTYDAETLERVFSVGEIKQATFTPAWGEGTSTDIKVDGSTTIALINIANDESFTITSSEDGIVSWNREGNTLTISAVKAGTTTLTLAQTGNAALAGNTAIYTITVSKYANTFELADETKAMKVEDVWENVVKNEGNGNTQVAYSTEDIAVYDAEANTITAISEGTTAITFTQEATDDHEGTSKTINITVTKVVNTLNVTIASTEMEVEGTITLAVSDRISDGATHAIISDAQLSSEVNNGTDVITYADNVITACNAGTAKIKFTQDATNKYTAYESETYTITVSKISNVITVTLDGEQKNSKNVGRGATVALGYSSPSDGAYSISLLSGSDDVATISDNTITAGTTDGTNIWEISQPETYKYSAASTSVRIKVNSVAEEEGYVLQDLSEHKWSTISSYTPASLSGPGETLTFEASKDWAGVNYFYVLYSTDGGANWVTLANPDLSNKWQSFSYTIPENATHVKFESRTGATLEKYVRNIRVTRKIYVRATASQTDLGDVYTDKTASTTFNVSYSTTNGGDIEIISNNPRYTVDTEQVNVSDNSDNVSNPVVVKVTYTPDTEHLGEDEAVITVSDRYYSAELTFTALAKKYPTTIVRGSNTDTEISVDGQIDNVFAFTGTSTATPSADSNDDFYYTIASTYTSDVHTDEGVITYDPATNTITGRNQGTAKLTIYQKNTDLYAATSQTFDFTVSKLDNPVQIALSTATVDVDGTATVQLTNDDGKGDITVTYADIVYTNESQNREGGLLSYNPETKTLTGVNAGTAVVTIIQAETYKYAEARKQINVTVNKLVQTLTWDNPDLTSTMQKGSTLEGNTATSSAELTPVTYASSNTAAIMVDPETGVLTANDNGNNITITASQAGNYKYAPAEISRQFSVFSQQTPAFVPDSHFAGTKGTIDWESAAIITVTGVSDDENFTITIGDNTVVSATREGSVITIEGLKIGSTTITLTQQANDDYIGKTETYDISVVMPKYYLEMDPTVTATSIAAGTYRRVFFKRTLKAGYTSLALPFNTTVEAIVGDGYNADEDWVAQMSAVTYNANDGYTLYFKKMEGGTIIANQPYILHLASEIDSPEWRDMEVVTPNATTIEAVDAMKGWTMTSNFTRNYNMQNKYGVVNSESVIQKGARSSTLNAYSAYITAPATSNAKVRVAIIGSDGATTIHDTDLHEEGDEAIFNPNGVRMNDMRKGLNIVRSADGKVKKVWVK